MGRALVERLLSEAGQVQHLLQIVLTVSEGNTPAVRLYRSCGFQVWGREPRAVIAAGEPITKLHMLHLLDTKPGAVR